MGNEKLTRTEEERKAALEEALKRVRLAVEKRTNDVGVMGRLEAFASKTDDATKSVEKKAEDKPMGILDLTKAINQNTKKAEEMGLATPAKETTTKPKDEKSATRDNSRDNSRDNTPLGKSDSKKEDDKKAKEDDKQKDPALKQKEKMKEMFSKVTLPSGMEIHEEAGKWVLVSKDGKQRTDITDVMNTIDKYNRDVDEANAANKMQNEAQNGVDKAIDVNKKDEGLNVNETNGKVKVVGEALPNVKDVEGKQVFDPQDIKKIAETALSYSDEKAMLAKLEDKENKNNKQANERKQAEILKQYTDMQKQK